MMKILFVHTHMFYHHTWMKVVRRLEQDGVDLDILPQHRTSDILQVLAEGRVDLFIGDLTQSLPGHTDIIEAAMQAKNRIGLSLEMPPDFSSLDQDAVRLFKDYLGAVSEDNFYNGIKYAASRVGANLSWDMFRPVRTHGIYHPDAPGVFESTDSYLNWFEKYRSASLDGNLVGVLCHHSQLVEENVADIDGIIRAIEAHGLVPLCVYCEGMPDRSLPREQRYPWLSYYTESERRPEVLLHFLSGRLLSHLEDSELLSELGVPVFQLIRNHTQTVEEWMKDPMGLSGHSLVYSIAQPEMAGVIEPTLAAVSIENPGTLDPASSRRFAPVHERMALICRRLRRFLRLRRLPNSEKRITFVLHNNPCKGVEATIGMAEGLDAFESLARVLRAMKDAGYHVGKAPESGREILERIHGRKAFSEFRWTTVEEILKKGGVLHRMGREEYEAYFRELPGPVRDKVLADWDGFPGQGMAFEDKGEGFLIITGIQLGNIKIMVQPKRGCYGPKCNGEVCRILHDPELSPPHHWLATYKYIRDTSDAVVHFGTEGSLEFLPGKRSALSDRCFPEVSLDDLPNVYVYVMNAPGDGVVAKRRGRAVLVDHLTPVYRPAELDEETCRLEALLDQYLKAVEMGETAREEVLAEEWVPLMKRLRFLEEGHPVENRREQARSAYRRIELSRRVLAPEGMHVLGVPPDGAGTARMLATILRHPSPELPNLSKIKSDGGLEGFQTFEDDARMIESILQNSPPAGLTREVFEGEHFQDLRTWCLDVGDRIQRSRREIPQLLKALDGGFIEPGLSGSVLHGKTDALPTGRNFFTTDVTVLPTRAAWEIGKKLADRLLIKFLKEENRFPENVGLSLWSSDAFKSDGEGVSQILYLLGVRPRWNAQGRVSSVEAIPLEELSLDPGKGRLVPRPRVDVTVQTSGILRDMVPNFCELIDEAVLLVGGLEEPDQWNFVRRHTRLHMEELRNRGLESSLSEEQRRRLASFRVFSSAPGTYGLGVGLALDASAWEGDADLAEAYVNWGGYAYGSPKKAAGLQSFGLEAHQLLARQLSSVDLTYMKQSSAEYDILDCGSYAVFQGGMAAAARNLSHKVPRLYWGDTNSPVDVDVRGVKEEIGRSARTRLLNRRWIEHMKEHGQQGARDVSGRVNNLFKWSATSRQVDRWIFDSVVETYLLDPENLEWLRQANPYALEEIARRLLEAHSRGLWNADPELLAAVQSAALLVEGDMEEIMGDVDGEFQGGKVEILTSKDVERWNPRWRLGQ
ncbi:MAG: cobaltochelatase subunit CobN [Syntrophobacteraceae bacterium]|nr:cobaltochelatase subunit CobN [Syntrophobacteraceae bacterium]